MDAGTAAAAGTRRRTLAVLGLAGGATALALAGCGQGAGSAGGAPPAGGRAATRRRR